MAGMRRLLLLAPLAFALPSTPASADPLCYGVTVVAVTTTTVTECVPYSNLVYCRTATAGVAPTATVTVVACQPRK